MALAPKIKMRNKTKVKDEVATDIAKVETIWSTMQRPSSQLNISQELLDYLLDEVRSALTGMVFEIVPPGNVWEGRKDADGVDRYRTIMAMGGERLTFENWYVGKKRGLIFQFQVLGGFAGIEPGGLIEFSMAHIATRKVLKDTEDTDLGRILEALPCVQPTAIEMTLNLENFKKSAVQKVVAADAKRHEAQHGEDWGAWQ